MQVHQKLAHLDDSQIYHWMFGAMLVRMPRSLLDCHSPMNQISYRILQLQGDMSLMRSQLDY